jgi:transcriptional regulator with XRE-family HTH domain
MKSLDQKMKALGASRRKRIEARAAELIAEEMTLQELRRARKVTPVRLAKELGIRQEGVSRLEKRSDLLLSTLRKAVRAMGGDLQLVAAFPNRAPVVLSGIGAPDPSEGREHGQGKNARLRAKSLEQIDLEKEVKNVRHEFEEQIRKRGERL